MNTLRNIWKNREKVIGLLALDVCGGSVVSVSLDENGTKILVKVLFDQGKEEYLSSSDMNRTVCTDGTENLDPSNIQDLKI